MQDEEKEAIPACRKTTCCSGLSDDAKQELNNLKRHQKYRFVTLRIEGSIVVPDVCATVSDGPDALKRSLPIADCRYCIYDLEKKTEDGRCTSTLLFISWLPRNAIPHMKMAYSSSQVAIRQKLTGLIDVAATIWEDIALHLGVIESDDEDSSIDM
eukprot:316528_1